MPNLLYQGVTDIYQSKHNKKQAGSWLFYKLWLSALLCLWESFGKVDKYKLGVIIRTLQTVSVVWGVTRIISTSLQDWEREWQEL